MRRKLAVTGLLLFALAGMLTLWGSPVVAQLPIGAVRIMDGVHNQLATVNHVGQLAVDATVTATVDNIRHISSVTHVAAAGGGFVIRDPINPNARARVDHTGALVTSATVSVSSDSVNVFHQSTVRHISSVTHVAIVDWQRSAHVAAAQSGIWNTTAHQGGSWTVTANAGSGTFTVGGTVTANAGTGTLAVNQSGNWTIQAAHQAGEWNVRHVGSVVHVAGATGARFVTESSQSGTWNVAAHQSGNWNVAHVTSITHVAAANGSRFHVQAANNESVRVTSNIETAYLACHERAAFSQTSSSIVVHTNGGFRILVCGIVVVSAHYQSVSFAEGGPTGACTEGRTEFIGAANTSAQRVSMVTAHAGGFVAVSPFPWVATRTQGNALCVMQSGSGDVSGVISYRYAP